MLNLVDKESCLESYLTDRVKSLGGKCLKFVSPGTAGVSDRLIVLPNLAPAFFELKRLGETPEPLQAKLIRDRTKLGSVSYTHLDGYKRQGFSRGSFTPAPLTDAPFNRTV